MSPLVIKLGGAVLERPDCLTRLFSQMQQSERAIVLVHGGGALVDQLLAQLGWVSEKKNGLRVTPFEQISVIAGALAGTANKQLLAQAQRQSVSAVGLCLSDGNVCDVSQLDPELGAVGQAISAKSNLLDLLLSQGYMPIISSIGIDADGQLLNVNADQAAVAIAQTLNAELLLLSDVSAVLDGQGEAISRLNTVQAQALIEDLVITDGMIVKVNAALLAAKELGRPITVAGWKDEATLPLALSGKSVGTQFCA